MYNKSNATEIFSIPKFGVRCAHFVPNFSTPKIPLITDVMHMTKTFLLLMFMAFSPATFSCSCSLGDVQKKFDEHLSVFMGTVKKITFYDSNDAFGDQRIKVEFELEKQWKGEPSQNVLFTVFNSVSCYGYWFKENQRYVFMHLMKVSRLMLGGAVELFQKQTVKSNSWKN
ncbi:MAG TPA: hypothetical protein PK055_00920 [Gammaproteobacteria bacterium]|nr:hypothetical protein [Xanthomonadales bacterium]HPI94930.1 hypothetical protein [Gammaproteobacteria bacterium]HPQ86196.1 hypothetical protein [Gammaproteobacteria bacterium]